MYAFPACSDLDLTETSCSGEPPDDLIGYVRDGVPAFVPDLQGTREEGGFSREGGVRFFFFLPIGDFTESAFNHIPDHTKWSLLLRKCESYWIKTAIATLGMMLVEFSSATSRLIPGSRSMKTTLVDLNTTRREKKLRDVRAYTQYFFPP